MPAPLSAQQKNIWYIEQVRPNTSIGVIATSVKIKGKIDYFTLQQAINACIESDENLRIRITLVEGEPRQYISEYRPQKIDFFDFSITQKEGLYQWDTSLSQQPFVLLDSDLFYFAFYKINESEGGFFAKFHHIISDGWTIVLLGNRIMDNYNRLLNGEPLQKEKQPSYMDFIERQNKYLSSPLYEADKQYWTEVVKRIPDQLGLKEYNLSNFSTVAKRKAYFLPDKLVQKIKKLSNEYRASTFSMLFSILSIYIYRITGRTRLSFGTPVINRQDAKEKNTIGMFINTVPIIIDIEEEMNFIEFNKYIIREWLNILRHQQYPYDRIVQEAKRHSGTNSKIYDIVFSYQNAKLVKGDYLADKMEGRWHFNGHQTHSLCIHVSERENDGRILLDYDYLAQVFTSKEIEYIHNHLINLLSDAIEYPEKKLFEVDLLDADEKHRVIKAFNQTTLEYDRSVSVHQMIEKQAREHPERIAAICGQETLTYCAMNEMSGSLAKKLVSQGMATDGIAGILLSRSPLMIVAMLAVLKAGGAFIPIDPSLPDERISYILQHSKASFLLTDQNRNRNITASETLITIEISNVIFHSDDKNDYVHMQGSVSPGNLAYIIYTSGTTGEPKGVMIEHRTLINFNAGMLNCMEYEPDTAVLSLASVGFDVFILETLPTLMNGLRVVMADEDELKDPSMIAHLIQDNKVKKIYLTPSRLQTLLLDEKCRDSLTYLSEIVCGGEEFPSDLIALLRKTTNALIFNQYGPTETTIGVTIKPIDTAGSINIGKPMANIKVYILDPHRNPLPIGAPGELYIGGDCLARGYLGSTALTNECFVESPFNPSEKLYKTGDMARWYPRGEIAFLGRIDRQVKIRGFRIELKEIESCIKKHGMVANAAVNDLADSQGNRYLCAYIVSKGEIHPKEIRQFLSQQLPHYMLPAFYMQIDSIPLTTNGKVDYASLPKPDIGVEGGTEFAAPSTSIETELANIWQKVLGLDTIGVMDNYFQMGGDSLNAIMMIVAIHRAFNVNLLFTDVYKSPTIRQLAQIIGDAKQNNFIPLQRAPQMGHYPLSASQKRLYVLSNIEQNNIAYNMPGAFRIKGKLDIEKLERAFNILLDRHEILRTSFRIMDSTAVQTVHDHCEFQIEELEIIPLESAVARFVRPFNLAMAPLVRVGVMEISKAEYILLLDMHHIITDGASSAILMEELNTLYRGGVLGNQNFQYKDYVLWAGELADSPWMKKQEEYWQNQFEGEIPVLDLPSDHPRNDTSNYQGNKKHFALDEETSQKIAGYCKERNVSLFMYFLANWSLFLSQMSGQRDIIIGSPSLGRRHSDLVDIVGAFINTLPMRCNPHPDKTFEQYLHEIKELTIAALDNQDYPFDKLVETLPLPKDLSRNPLFDTMFVMQTIDSRQMKLGELDIEPVEIDTGISKFDLMLEAVAFENIISFTLEYSSLLFEEKTIERFSQYFLTLVKESIIHDEDTLCDIECMDVKEKNRLLNEYNQTEKAYIPSPIDLLFDEQVKADPLKTALVFHNREISYGKLKEMADGIASMLAGKGIGPGSVVGLLFHRGVALMTSLWGVIKSGAAYMPIDPAFPEERIKYMLETSQAKMLLTGEDLTANCGNTEKMCIIEEDMPLHMKPAIPLHSPDDNIYVLFTSGSTGKPKGVMITHRSVHNLINGVCDMIPYNQDDVFLCSTTVCFDVFATEAILSLAKGMKVVMADEEEQRLPWKMAELIHNEKVTAMQLTPSRMRVLMNDPSFRTAISTIKTLILAGESLPLDLVRQIKASSPTKIYNMYGPTENTIYATGIEVKGDTQVSIGKGLANVQVYILDEKMRPLPQGAVGELYLSGEGTAKGYINQDGLTRERFLPNPFKNNPGLMYRTGDLARIDSDGNLLYLGRSDHQIKIRGLRVETEEVEMQIMESGMIAQVVVTPVNKDDGTIALCAYVVLHNKKDLPELKRYISKRLPDYMIPAYFHIMDYLPLNVSGKIDRLKLPVHETAGYDVQKIILENPEVENELRAIWSEVLKNDSIHPRKSFFEQGGDSLSAIIVQTQYHAKGWDISTRDFYHFPTIVEQARLIYDHGDSADDFHVFKEYPSQMPETSPSLAPVLGNIFITGATGFLGAHLIKEILENNESMLWCLVRGKDPFQRLKDSMDWYHGEGYLTRNMSRIRIIQGDITLERFGLCQEEYNALVNSIDSIVHAAADVRHYGDPGTFDLINSIGTRHVIEFMKSSNAHLFHASTTSVAADHITKNPEKFVEFTEKDFYIGQNYDDNDYIKSKFDAEEQVIRAISEGFKATILRIGNLTGRYSDGVFQKNIESNAFYQRIRAFMLTNAAPEELRNIELELTPVDICAEAIRYIMEAQDTVGRTFHLSNPNLISFDTLVEKWGLYGNGFTWEQEQRYQSLVENGSIKLPENAIFYLRDLLSEGEKIRKTIRISTWITEQFLHQLNFNWKRLDEAALKRLLDHMIDRGFVQKTLITAR